MQLGLRIKASDAFEDRFARIIVGAEYKDGKHPKFVFRDEVQRMRYDQIRKRIKGGKRHEGVHSGNKRKP
ncbi:hypothetical protein [Staphylococcus warneri]|uniref:hypothetical protein n=1 Tax=Staphylococcus warneri TaxID=1292 RepID=UPI003B9EF8BD